ncbi:flavodoxin [Promicromonospora soli]
MTDSLDRRSVLRTGLALGAAVLAGAASGCTGAQPDTSSSSASPDATDSAAGRRRKVLLAYFSRAGENYHYGGKRTLEVGNTQVVAEMIEQLADVDVYVIQAADPYPEDYEQTVDRNVREQRADARPEIARPLPDLEPYDTVLLGSGVWNVRAPMIMRTFVDGVNLARTAIHPFVTYAVSGMGRVADEYAEMCPDSTVSDGLAVQGEEVARAEPQVREWLQRIGLLSAASGS